MKNFQIKTVFALLVVSLLTISCNNDDTVAPTTPTVDFSGTYVQQDQMGRPAINTVFVVSGNKDAFNTTTPSNMDASFQSAFQTRLLALNAGYTTNALGQDAAALTGLLATDVLNVSTTGTTTFYDSPSSLLTGRTLANDVIDVELLLIFGGPNGTDNPGLTNDNVNSNDKPFSATFPYLASPW